jgi:ABC-type Fe3+/spermidine/putrescine transport system ATPase subunit
MQHRNVAFDIKFGKYKSSGDEDLPSINDSTTWYGKSGKEAKDEIYKLLTKLASEGKSIIMISSELPEILRMSDRIAVMCEGKLTGIIDNKDADQNKIMQYATKFRS